MLTASVIIPNYNNEKYLHQCLDSVLAQTFRIKEVIIYDDCSTDRSREILEKYELKDQRIRVIYGKSNVGVSVARDRAIKATTSDYVCMLDADDYFYSNTKIEKEMQKVQKIFEQTGKKVVVFSQTVDVDEGGSILTKLKPMDLSGNERFKIITRRYSNYMPRDYCFPREYYDLCGGYTKDLALYEDWELNLKLLQLTNFVYSGGYGTAYRHKAGGLSSVNYKMQLETKINIIQKFQTSSKERICFYAIAYGAFLKNEIKDFISHHV